MYLALENEKGTPFRIPSKARLVKINLETGNLAKKKDKNVILEAFAPNSQIKDYNNQNHHHNQYQTLYQNQFLKALH